MAVHIPKDNTENLYQWRVAKKISPSGRGAIKLARLHGNRLLCVRYRESPEGTERLTTVELLVERVPIQRRGDPIVAFKLQFGELELRRQAMSKGATFDGQTYLWRLRRSEVERLGLGDRITATNEDL